MKAFPSPSWVLCCVAAVAILIARAKMPTGTKSDLLRKTADEFDDLMGQFDQTKANLVAALNRAQLKDEAIAEHVRAFDEGKRLIAELLPIRDNVEAMKNAIVKPVADVIADSSDTNKHFGWAGLTIGAFSIIISFVVPRLPFLQSSPDNDRVVQKLDDLRTLLQPAAKERLASTWHLLLYDRFEGTQALVYEGQGLLQVGEVGRRHGYESIGFEPREALVYRAVSVPCEKGCKLSVEAMVKLGEYVDISLKQVADGKFLPVAPIQVEYSTVAGADWKPLEPLQSAIKVEWIASRNRWQSVKTPYIEIPAQLGATTVRLTLQPYRWERPGGPGQPLRCATSFDEVKLFASGL
jgi:hypothetical protein